MTIETAVIACVVSLATFFLGRLTAAKNDGERWGALTSNINHMKDDISDIKTSIEKNAKGAKADIERLADESRDSVRRLHRRLDDHLRHEHGMNIPKRDDD